ncbi:Uncharacterized conserved protein, DUF58 family, contains vWF domain [Thermococcus thioreducens]|uniref:Uncharacterized conserved protein, DUF58 family, contains vWF domain n=2 Tax=Thermococcus thioreducens TaxID=277988 RepID=A0A1I0NYP8_9EURY|nr:Uncharacterized conserved protein, DUF58 family, contains vWF domain [Thermococcus thioreducens]
MQAQPPLYGTAHVEEREEAPTDEMLPTEKAEEILIALWLIVMFAFLLLRWEMVYLTLPAIWLLFIAVFFFKPRLNVEIERIIPHNRFLEGTEIEIVLRIKSHERIPTLKITEDIPPGLELVEGQREHVLSLRPGEEREIRYRVRVKRGIHEFNWVRLRYLDPFGFFRVDRKVDVYSEIVGVPIITDVPTPYSTRGTKITVGPLPSPRVGEGVEFHAIRDYQPGDPLKIINWKATARTGRIMANEYESERKVDVVFIVDASYTGTLVFDHLIRATASLMLNALNNGTSFGLLLAEDVPLWIRVDYGKRHFFKCIDFLSTAKPDKNNMIAYQVEHLIKARFPPKAQLLYFSPLLTEESREALKIMARYGYNVVVISPNPYTAVEPKSREEELAVKLLTLQRKAVLMNMSAYGIIIDWDVRKPLEAAIAEVVGL